MTQMLVLTAAHPRCFPLPQRSCRSRGSGPPGGAPCVQRWPTHPRLALRHARQAPRGGGRRGRRIGAPCTSQATPGNPRRRAWNSRRGTLAAWRGREPGCAAGPPQPADNGNLRLHNGCSNTHQRAWTASIAANNPCRSCRCGNTIDSPSSRS